MTVSTAARQLGIAERTVRDRIRKGKLTARKEGGFWLIDPESIGNVGNVSAGASATSATPSTIAVPLERYEALVTRLAQLEVENQQYRALLEDKRRPDTWWRRVFKRKPG